MTIVERLEKYRPEGSAALTIAREVKDPMKLRQMMGAQMAFAKLFNCYMAWGQYQCLRKRGFGPN